MFLSPELRSGGPRSLAACVCGWTLLRDKLAKGERDTKVVEELFFSRQTHKWELWRFPSIAQVSEFGLLVCIVCVPVGLSLRPPSALTLPFLLQHHCSPKHEAGHDVNRHKEIIVKSISAPAPAAPQTLQTEPSTR